jgi:hypothetical protein
LPPGWGYPLTAEHVFRLSGVRPEISRETTAMHTGDQALVVRLKYRVQEPGMKGAHRPEADDWEYGVLELVK